MPYGAVLNQVRARMVPYGAVLNQVRAHTVPYGALLNQVQVRTVPYVAVLNQVYLGIDKGKSCYIYYIYITAFKSHSERVIYEEVPWRGENMGKKGGFHF